jgi:hypothetical protein
LRKEKESPFRYERRDGVLGYFVGRRLKNPHFSTDPVVAGQYPVAGQVTG